MFIHPAPLVELSDRNMDTLSDAEFFGNSWMKWLHEHIVINREIRWVKKFLPQQLDMAPRMCYHFDSIIIEKENKDYGQHTCQGIGYQDCQ